MFTLRDHMNKISDTKKALQRLTASKQDLIVESTSQKRLNRSILEEFTIEGFEEKVLTDSIFYNVLISELKDEFIDDVQLALGSMLNTVHKIYEHINIKPKIYSVHKLASKSEPDSVIEESAKSIINSFIKRQYYDLTTEQRCNQYHNVVKGMASDFIINEGISAEEAVEFSIKIAVMRNLIENICFPSIIREEINGYLISESYSEFFDPEKLQEMWDDFMTKSETISKVVASII